MFTQYSGKATFEVRFDEGTAPVQGRHNWQGRIFPTFGQITFYPGRNDGTGPTQYSVKITGPMVKKDGTPSKTEATYDWYPGVWPEDADMPIVKAMHDAFVARAEAAIRPQD